MNNDILNVQDCWLTTDIVAELKGITERAVRLAIRKRNILLRLVIPEAVKATRFSYPH